MTDPTPEITPTRDEAVPERPRIEPLLKDGDVVERLKQFRMRWQESGDLTYLGKTLVDAIVEIEALRKALDIPALAERILFISEMTDSHLGHCIRFASTKPQHRSRLNQLLAERTSREEPRP